jgi:ribonuclease-3
VSAMQTDTSALAALQERIAYRFRNLLLLTQALTHRSFLNEGRESGEDNERLEFLGDSVIEVVVSHLLLVRFPHLTEGGLSKMRAELVKEATLASLAHSLQLDQVLRLGRGEEETGGREKASILAGGFEALMAAVYLDGGYAEVFRLIEGLYTPLFGEVTGTGKDRDFKTRLQEYTQLHLQVAPQYTVTREHGPDHAKTFEVVITINGRPYGRGQGQSKKKAEQQAAEEALQSLQGD